jgi:hypothetical protein
MDRLVTLQPLCHDFWRVTLGTERSIEVYTEERALRLAEEWARFHPPCELKICDVSGNVVRLVFIHVLALKGGSYGAPGLAP